MLYNGHLSIEELEELSQQKGPAENQGHIENCRQCKELLEDCQAISVKLAKLASVHIGAGNGMNCPDPGVWLDVAAGTLSSEETAKHVQHAADCPSCGPKLRTATQLFADELTPEEEKAISSLPSANRDAQKKLAERWASSIETRPMSQLEKGTHKRSGFFSWRLPGLVFAGLAITVFLGFEGYRSFEIREARQAVDRKYQRGRPTEYRIAGVPYSGPSAIRGEAESSYVEVPDWLNQPILAARAAFLARDWSAAAAALEKALEEKPSAEVFNDLAVAYALQAESSRNDDLYEKALKYSERVSPPDPTMYFNRALICEKLGRRQEAKVNLQKFIELEPDPQWKDEANTKLRLLL